MQWQLIVALVTVIPVILLPAAFVWYLNFGGLIQTVREARQVKAAQGKKAGTVTEEVR